MSNKTDFQVRVLRRYGVIPVFEGDPEYNNVKTSEPGETFKQWCARVIGKRNAEVSLYQLYQPRGNEKIGKLGCDGDNLKKIVQSQSRKSFLKGLNHSKLDGDHDTPDDWLPVEPRFVSRDELYDTLADAVTDRTPAIDEFFNRFSDIHAGNNSWAGIVEALAREYSSLASAIKNSNGKSPC